MTRCRFLTREGVLTGFAIGGHTGFAALGSDVVCAAVSSAALMTANTITEVCRVRADIEEGDGRLKVLLPPGADVRGADRCRDVLEGFRLHMTELARQYPRNVHVETIEISTEVGTNAETEHPAVRP